MKKILFFTYLFCLTFMVNAQDLISKIPKDARVVVTLKGENITDLVSISEFESSKIGKLFLDELQQDSDGKVSNLNELGIDLNRSFYYFMKSDSIAITHSFLVPLKNKTGFESLLSKSKTKKIKREDDLSYFVDSYDDIVVMWDNSTLLVTIEQSNGNRSYDYDSSELIEESIEEVVEVAGYPILNFVRSEHDFGNIIDGDVVEHTFKFTNTGSTDLLITNAKASCGCTVPSYPKTPIAPGASGTIDVKFNSANKSNQQNKTITITANTENGTEKLKIKAYVNPIGTELIVDIEETILESTESEYEEEDVIESTESNDNNDDYEKRRQKREHIQVEKNKDLIASAKSTMLGNYADGSILKNASYVKAIGKGQDEAVAWVQDMGSIYSDVMQKSLAYELGSNYLGLYNSFDDLYGNMSFVSKINFEKTQATLSTSYTMNDDMAKYSKAIYNGKMNNSFFKYFNEDKMLGYFSVNSSTEGLLETYPEMMGNMFEKAGEGEMASFIPIGMRLLSLLIDEEGAAKILRGDMLFVLTEMKEREVSYTTYDYDDNYERTAVTKTKTETLPDFLMMVTSSDEDLFNKIMNAIVKESNGEVTLVENGMYQLNTRELPYVVNVMYKNNAILIGSSPEDMMAIHKGAYDNKVSGKHKKMINKNASVIYVNGKHIASKFPKELMPSVIRNKIDFISDNTEDVIFKVGKTKGNAMKGEMILNTPEKEHKNSLAYFLNMINALVN